MTSGDWIAVTLMTVTIMAIVIGQIRMYGLAWLFYCKAHKNERKSGPEDYDVLIQVGLNRLGWLIQRLAGRMPMMKLHGRANIRTKLHVTSGHVILCGPHLSLHSVVTAEASWLSIVSDDQGNRLTSLGTIRQSGDSQ